MTNDLAEKMEYKAGLSVEEVRELAEFHGRGLSPDNFCSGNSGVEVLSLIKDATIKAGEHAIICPPCFGAYSTSE